jgi:ComF family protein
MKKIRAFLVMKNLFFPPKCASCGEILDPFSDSPRAFALCDRCFERWKAERSELCSECGYEARLCTCVPELLDEAGVDKLVKLVEYKPKRAELVSSRLIYKLKRTNNKAYFDFLGEELRGRLSFELGLVSEQSEDVIFTYAPRRRGAVAEFGHDQARMLMYSCADALGFDRRTHCKTLVKRSFGGEQKRLNAKERAENVRLAFALNGKEIISGKTVVIFDDVVTSGASMGYCAELLMAGGAKRVLCVSIAKSQKNL